MIPGDLDTHEVVVIRPGDGTALRWATYRSREAADVERVAGVSLSQPPERLTEEFVTRMAEALLYAIPYEKPADIPGQR